MKFVLCVCYVCVAYVQVKSLQIARFNYSFDVFSKTGAVTLVARFVLWGLHVVTKNKLVHRFESAIQN